MSRTFLVVGLAAIGILASWLVGCKKEEAIVVNPLSPACIKVRHGEAQSELCWDELGRVSYAGREVGGWAFKEGKWVIVPISEWRPGDGPFDVKAPGKRKAELPLMPCVWPNRCRA